MNEWVGTECLVLASSTLAGANQRERNEMLVAPKAGAHVAQVLPHALKEQPRTYARGGLVRLP